MVYEERFCLKLFFALRMHSWLANFKSITKLSIIWATPPTFRYECIMPPATVAPLLDVLGIISSVSSSLHVRRVAILMQTRHILPTAWRNVWAIELNTSRDQIAPWSLWRNYTNAPDTSRTPLRASVGRVQTLVQHADSEAFGEYLSNVVRRV